MFETDKPIISLLTLRRDLYLVTSLLLADKEVAKMPKMTAWTQDFYSGEVKRLMLWVATAARSLLDTPDAPNKRGDGKGWFGEKRCGEYWADFPDGAKCPLEFRQACNSVIHANVILPYRVPLRGPARSIKQVYANRVTVQGIHRNRTTRAYLDVVRFVKIANAMLNFFEEKDHANL